MKTTSVYGLLVAAFAASPSKAAVLPRQHGFVPANSCCFTLHESSRTGTIIREDPTTGVLRLGGSDPEGWFCTDLSSPSSSSWNVGVLRDEVKNACFVTSSDEVKCHDQMPGPQTWALVSKSGARIVTYDGQETYKACADGDSEAIFGVDKGGCRKIKVEARGFRGRC